MSGNEKERPARIRQAIGIIGLIVLLGGIHWATLRAGHEWGDDFSLYVAHARNLAEGRDYADTGFIYDSQSAVVSPRCYPPVFPLLLAPVYRLFGMDLTAMKAFVVLLFMAVLGVLAVLFRKRLPLPLALGCLVLFALNPYVWQHKDRLLSETPFMLFAYLALLLAKKAQEIDGSRTRRLAWGVAAGLAAYLAFGTRTVGVVLLPSVLAGELLRRRRLEIASIALLAAFAAGVGVQKLFLPSDGSLSYLDQLVFDPLRFLRIGFSLVMAMGAFLENGYSGPAAALLYGCLLILAGLAFGARLRNRPTVYEFFAAFNFLLLTVWPAAESDRRFLLPLLPLFLLYAGEGLCRLGRTSLGMAVKPVAAALALAILASYAGCYTRLELGPVRDGISSPEAIALFDWIRERTAQEVFLFQKPRALALYTQRPALAHPIPGGDEHLWGLLHSKGVTHVIVCLSSACEDLQASRQILEPFVERHGDRFVKVYANPGFRVYRFRETSLASR